MKKLTEKSLRPYTLPGLLLVLFITVIIYLPSLKGGFLYYDDTDNVVNNPLVRELSLQSLPRFFSADKLYMFTPVTFISYAVDYRMAGMDPFAFRLTSLLLHLLNILLVFVLAGFIFRRKLPALFVAVLFAVHPMNADTVAWISARSNLLSGTFILLTLVLYYLFLRKNNPLFLVLSIASFLLSLLSKSTGLLLPFLLVITDYFERRKCTVRTLLEKAPYLLFSLLIGLLTVYFRSDTGSTQSVIAYSIPDRVFMLFHSLSGYLVKSVIPLTLSEVYAYPLKTGGFLPFWYYLSPACWIVIFFLIVRFPGLRGMLLPGMFFFLLLILPTQAVLLEDGFMANRYAYIPLIGLFFIVVAVIDRLLEKSPVQGYRLIPLVLVPFAVFSVYSYHRSLNWKNTFSVFDHALRVSPRSAFSYNNRGLARYMENDLQGALNDYNSAISLNPSYAGCYYNRGIIHYENKRYPEALGDYSEAIRLNPKFASAFNARGILYMDAAGNDSLALPDYDNAIRLNPSFAQAYYNRGLLFLRKQDLESACRDFQKVRGLGYPQADALISRFCGNPGLR